MKCQRDDGAYMNGHTDYTSVIYPAKSLLEFADVERTAGRKKQAARLEASANVRLTIWRWPTETLRPKDK